MGVPSSAVLAGWSDEQLALYARAREAFIHAGARAVETLDDFDQSIQVSVKQRNDDLIASGILRSQLIAWKRAKLFDEFFFVRKHPGIRLRFFTHSKTRLSSALLAFLEKETRRGSVIRYATTVYEGETFQFGGESGMNLMHAHGTYDSMWALALQSSEKRASVDVSILSLIVLNDLIRKVVGDAFEGWDVWENMRLVGRVHDHAIAPEDLASLQDLARSQRSLLRSTFFSPETIIEALRPGERRLMRDYFAQNAKWQRKYASVVRDGNLLYGMRKILPFYVIFHWNRLKFSDDTQVALTYYMRSALNPKDD